ncbi:retrovirus-related pol polyprotein from transposon TNT 1-94 [Tanacetum coccineum]
MENANLKGQIQEKVFVTTTLQSELRILKGKHVLDNATIITNATTIALKMFVLDIEPLSHRLKNNRDAHEDYLKKTIEILTPYELLVYVSQTCPSFTKPNEKLVAVTPMNKVKKVGLKSSTSASRSQPTCNRKNDRISFTSANLVLPKESTSNSVETQKPELKVYRRIPKLVKSASLSKKAKIGESRIANNSKPNHSWGSNATDVPSSSSLVNDRLSRLFSNSETTCFLLENFCDSDLEVAFQKNTCIIRNLDGVDLHSGSRDTNLYIISLDDMLKTSPIYLLSKASKTKSWLWHPRLSHLNFGTLNKLAKYGLARGIPKLKSKKDHLCSTCSLGKSKKSSYQPKAEVTNQKKLYLLHMDLCGPIHVESINRKKYILVIVDDYLLFTWVKFLRSKDEAPDAIIKCISNIQVRLNATVRNVRTDNGT